MKGLAEYAVKEHRAGRCLTQEQVEKSVMEAMGWIWDGYLLNKVNFGEYIEDILTRILCGEEVDASFLPCDYVRHFENGTDAEVTKTSQAVAWL